MLSFFTKAFKAPLMKRVCLNYQKMMNFASYSLVVSKSSAPAIMERKKDELLIKQWWSQSPFDKTKPLATPVYNFATGQYAGENVELDHGVFNVPLRRDIVHRVYTWRLNYGKRTTHVTRTKGTTAGSGAKPHKQKGTGRARQGNKRAPGRKKGGKAHGAKAMDYTFPIPKKIRTQGLKIMLSAKLAEGKLRIIDSEKLDAPKTRLVAQSIKEFGPKARILIVTGYTPDSNFEIAQENIQTVEYCLPHKLDILQLLKCDKLFITKEGAEQVIQHLKDQTEINFQVGTRLNREKKPSEIVREQIFDTKPKAREQPKYDPSQPLNFKFKVLQEYLKDYEAKRGQPDEQKK